MSETPSFKPGGDATAIADTARKYYGGYREMFDAHGWDASGEKLMTSAPRLIVDKYGSIRAFQDAHQTTDPATVWDNKSVYITSFWGWSPETWGCIGFTGKNGEGRRKTLLKSTTDPFLMCVYVTDGADPDFKHLWGKVAGFYEVSHVEGDRDEFLAPQNHQLNPDQWRHSLKAVRAFEIVPEFQPTIDELDPTIRTSKRYQAVAKYGEALTPEKVDFLKSLPLYEVPVYRGSPVERSTIMVPDRNKKKVGGGALNYSGYYVPAEPRDTPKELYVLKLAGDVTAFLGEPANGRDIFKVGLSMSPELRRRTFQKALPKGAFHWEVFRTTTGDGDRPYQGFEIAEAGENFMKTRLGNCGDWLGGEFYAATVEDIEQTWQFARGVALKASIDRK